MQRHAVRFSVATELEPVEGNWNCRRAGQRYGRVGTAAGSRGGFEAGTEAAATATGNGSAQPGGTRRTSGKMERQTHGRTVARTGTDGQHSPLALLVASLASLCSLGAGATRQTHSSRVPE